MTDTIVEFANLEFRGLTKDILLEETEKLKIICTVNAEYIVHANRDQVLRKYICDNYSTFDGQVPYLLARILRPRQHFEKISGSDFFYDIVDFAFRHKKKLFFLGGHADSNAAAVERVRKEFEVLVEGFSPSHMPLPFDEATDREIMARISGFQPDLLLVGFGARKQDYWIMEKAGQLQEHGVKWVVGIGGTFEFVSGKIKRAPRLVQRLGLEGVFRFCQEPKLFRLKRLGLSLLMFKYIWF